MFGNYYGNFYRTDKFIVAIMSLASKLYKLRHRNLSIPQCLSKWNQVWNEINIPSVKSWSQIKLVTNIIYDFYIYLWYPFNFLYSDTQEVSYFFTHLASKICHFDFFKEYLGSWDESNDIFTVKINKQTRNARKTQTLFACSLVKMYPNDILIGLEKIVFKIPSPTKHHAENCNISRAVK